MVSWLSGCFRPAVPQHSKEWDVSVASTTASAINESRSRLGVPVLSKLGSMSPPSLHGLRVDSFRLDIEAAAVNAALTKVGTLVQSFAKMRLESSCLKSMQQALTLITEEWPGAFACLYILSKDMAKALLLAGAVSNVLPAEDPRHPLPAIAFAPLISLHTLGLAMTAAMAAPSGCYSWDEQTSREPVPPDYAPFIAAGAQAVNTVVITLSGTNSAALTVGFVRGADSCHVTHELWPAYLKVIAAGMSPLILEPSVPQYLNLAVELSDSIHLEDAIVSVVRNVRLLSGQAGNKQLWFRVALICPDSRNAVLFDVPSEVLSALHISPAGRDRPSCGTLPRIGSVGTIAGRAGNSSPQVGRAMSASVVQSELSLMFGRDPGATAVLRTVVTLDNTMLRHIINKRQLAIVPNIQKLVNHGGGVAADIFAVQNIRPPAAMLLLPLVSNTTECAGASPTESCFGAVYCMSSVLTEFSDIKLRLCEAVMKVVSPHFTSALAVDPLASEYRQAVTQVMAPPHLPRDVSSSNLALGGKYETSAELPTTANLACDLSPGSPAAAPPAKDRVSVPNQYTNALVMGLADKINARRLVQSLDISEASNLSDLQLFGLLGAGGYGLVFRGKWCGMQAAVKLVNCPEMESGDASKTVLKHAHEIAILSSVSHPNIIQAYGFLTNVSVSDVIAACLPSSSPEGTAGCDYPELLAMAESSCHIEVLELCDQGSLSDALQRKEVSHPFLSGRANAPRDKGQMFDSASHPTGGGDRNGGSVAARGGAGGVDAVPQLDMHCILLSLMELASALAHLHSLGIVHCDIKPDNVLLESSHKDERGFTVKLSDFGLSRVQDDDGFHSFPSNSRGTLAYLSPEALSGEHVDRSTDVYSFGILMFELYANANPFAGLGAQELFHRVVKLGQRPRFPAGSHDGYVCLARSCWHKMPAQRPSFDDVVNALKRLLMAVKTWPAPVKSPVKE